MDSRDDFQDRFRRMKGIGSSTSAIFFNHSVNFKISTASGSYRIVVKSQDLRFLQQKVNFKCRILFQHL